MGTIADTLYTMLSRLQLSAIRDQRRVAMGTSIAKFPYVRTLDGFDFEAQPSIDPKQVRELATGRWIANGDTVLLQGPPGVGKTHLAVALGREAIARGYAVLLTTNRSIGEWGEIFGDTVIATAILDRLLHHSHVITIRGESFRQREKRRSGLVKPAFVESPS